MTLDEAEQALRLQINSTFADKPEDRITAETVLIFILSFARSAERIATALERLAEPVIINVEKPI